MNPQPATSLYQRIYTKYREFTMIPEATYIRNLRLAERVRDVEGCIVECGVWRGGMIAGIAELLGPDRQYVLFDSFAGLPAAQAIDGPQAIAWQADIDSPAYYDNCSAPIESARTAMRMSGARYVAVVPGWFRDTLPEFAPPAPVALLRLDGDWYESTMLSLTCLYPHMAQQGLIVMDDYYTWDGCSRAVHEFLARESSTWRIHQFEEDVCILSPRLQETDRGSMEVLPPFQAGAIEIRMAPDLRMRSGSHFSAAVTLVNHSPWDLRSAPPYPVHLAHHWLSADGGTVVHYESQRTRLVPALRHGSAEEYRMVGIAPAQPGSYILRATLVQERVRWFDNPPGGVFCEVWVDVD